MGLYTALIYEGRGKHQIRSAGRGGDEGMYGNFVVFFGGRMNMSEMSKGLEVE